MTARELHGTSPNGPGHRPGPQTHEERSMRVALTGAHGRPLSRPLATTPTTPPQRALLSRCAALARRLLGRDEPISFADYGLRVSSR